MPNVGTWDSDLLLICTIYFCLLYQVLNHIYHQHFASYMGLFFVVFGMRRPDDLVR